jgi:hypothetical protein
LREKTDEERERKEKQSMNKQEYRRGKHEEQKDRTEEKKQRFSAQYERKWNVEKKTAYSKNGTSSGRKSRVTDQSENHSILDLRFLKWVSAFSAFFRSFSCHPYFSALFLTESFSSPQLLCRVSLLFHNLSATTIGRGYNFASFASPSTVSSLPLV